MRMGISQYIPAPKNIKRSRPGKYNEFFGMIPLKTAHAPRLWLYKRRARAVKRLTSAELVLYKREHKTIRFVLSGIFAGSLTYYVPKKFQNTKGQKK